MGENDPTTAALYVDRGNPVGNSQNPTTQRWRMHVKVDNVNGEPIPITGTFTIGGCATPKIYNLAMAASGTEYYQALSNDTLKVTVKLRELAKLQLAFNAGESSTKFLTIPAGCNYEITDLKTSGCTLYVQSDKSNVTLEIVEWT
jgi:hypothetical protein